MKFQVIQPMKSFSRPLCIEKESHNDTDYYRHGPGEQGDTYCYIQYTLSGRGVYSDNTGTYSLPLGKMILMSLLIRRSRKTEVTSVGSGPRVQKASCCGT